MALSKHPANWKAIRAEFQSTPLSIRSIALKFNVPKSTLLNRIRVEQWQRSIVSNMTDLGGHGPMVQPDGPTDVANTVAIAQAILKLLTEAVSRGNIDIRELKSLSDTLASCQKVIIAAGPAAQEPRRSYLSPELIAVLEPHEQDMVETILVAAEQRLAALREETVSPMKRGML
jgi:hypothetical protein